MLDNEIFKPPKKDVEEDTRNIHAHSHTHYVHMYTVILNMFEAKIKEAQWSYMDVRAQDRSPLLQKKVTTCLAEMVFYLKRGVFKHQI